MRDILFVITDLQVGGTERQLALLAGGLAKSGSRVAVYSFMDGAVRAQLEANGVEVIVAPASLDFHSSIIKKTLGISLAAVHLFWLLLTSRPRLVHFFLPAAYLIGAPLAFLACIPVRVMSRRSLNTYQRRYFVRAVERRCHSLMHAVLGNSRVVVNQLEGEGVRADRLGLIYNGVDDVSFADPAKRGVQRQALDLPPAALVMCIVANLIPYKGHQDVIDALALAAPSLPPEWRLLVVGRDDGIGKQIRTQAERLGQRNHILFLGPRSDVTAILGASDIGILCSHEEGFSNAILEGMAAGLPMVVTDVGGNAEAVIGEATGLVVPPRDIKRLAAGIIRLANDSALRAQLGAAGRQRVAGHFGSRQYVDNHCKLYDALLAGKAPAGVPGVGFRAGG